jgi:hypothetical protein
MYGLSMLFGLPLHCSGIVVHMKKALGDQSWF